MKQEDTLVGTFLLKDESGSCLKRAELNLLVLKRGKGRKDLSVSKSFCPLLEGCNLIEYLM